MSDSTVPPGGPDRDLLLAALALQLGFVDADPLRVALQEWASDRSRSITHILVDQHALIPRRVPLLEGVANEYIAQNSNDATLALAAFCSSRVLPIDIDFYSAPRAEQATLAGSPSTLGGGSVPDIPPAADTGQPRRFRIIRPHARGALGQVFLAHDDELKREVALKEMQEPYAANADSRARFLTEAEITGQLEHPGIVPVYGLGYHPDGRPYYAMRFIRGESLHDAIVRFHAGRGGKADPEERALGLRRLLGRFVAVCNAIAYAHSRGVIHRDIKPSNVMLGPYGETLVVDWGLAKAAGRPVTQDSVEMPIPPVGAQSGISTMLGVAVGTPAFMPPEQASGKMNEVGPRSDIYSLGATLYHLLTGEFPFSGESATEIVDKVKAAQLLPPRKANREVPPPLEAIVMKAMAKDAKERYASAHELAQEVERWMADEPVRAHKESAWAQSMRWMRRNRPLVAGLGALLMTALVGLAAGLWAVGREQTRTRQELNRAEDNLKLARRAVDQCFILATRDPLLQAEKMRPVRKMLLERALPFYEGFQVHNPKDPELRKEMGENLFRVAHILSEQNNKRGALKVYEQARDVFQGLSAGGGDMREALGRVWNNLGKIHHDLDARVDARAAYNEALLLHEALAKDAPNDADAQLELAQTHNNLGALDQDSGDVPAALIHLNEARRLALPFAADNTVAQRALGATARNLGFLVKKDDPKGAMAYYDESLGYHQRLADKSGRDARQLGELATTLTHIAALLAHLDRHDDAMRAYERAGELLEDALAGEMPDYLAELATVDDNIGSLYRDLKKPEEAEKAYARSLARRSRLVKENPEADRFRYDLAGTRINLANVKRDNKAPADAVAIYGQTLPLLLKGYDPLKQKPPEDESQAARLRYTLHSGRAEALGKLGRHAEAARDWDAARWLADGRDLRNDAHAQAAGSRARMGDLAWCLRALDALEKRSPSKDTLYLMACASSLASAAATGDEKERFAARAVDYLRCARAAGYFDDPDNVKHARETDDDLMPLRGRKDFAALMESLSKGP